MTTLHLVPNPIRFAVPQDARQLLDLTRLVHAESGIFPLSEAKVMHEIEASIRQQNGVIGVIGAVGAPVGAAWLIAIEEWYTEAPAIVERYVFVHPDHRNSTHARDLLEWAKAMSDRLGPLLIGVINNNTRAPAKLRFYRSRFGEPTGFFFAYNLRGLEVPGDRGAASSIGGA